MSGQNTAIKRIVALSCLGIDIYMLVLYAVQVGMAECGSFVVTWMPDLMDYADTLNGLSMIAAVLSGAVLLWLYVQETYDASLMPCGISMPIERDEAYEAASCGERVDSGEDVTDDAGSSGVYSAESDSTVTAGNTDKAAVADEQINHKTRTGSTFKDIVLRRHRRFGICACISFAALMYVTQLLALIVQSIAELIFNTIGYTVLESPAADMDYTTGKVVLLYALLIGPFIEELVFRGFLLNALRPCGKAYAVLISAVMFSLMHADVEQIFFTFAAGLILGYVAAEYSIWASLLLHIINNGIYGELLLYMQEVLPEVAYVIIAVVLMLGSIVLGIVLAVRYRGRLREYIHSNPTVPGAYAALKNRWFVAFAACMIGLTWMTVTKL